MRMLLNSTLNIEFVYVMLEGIVKFSKMTFALDSSREAENLSFQRFGLSGDISLTMRQICVENFDAWEPKESQKHIKKELKRRQTVQTSSVTNILEQSARSLGENVIDPKGSMMIDTNFKITYHCMD